MRDDWELYACGADAAEAILQATFGIEVRKGLNPLNLRDFQQIVRSLATSLKGQVVPVEDAALKQALNRLDAKWTDLGPEARAKLIGEAAHYLGPPVVAKVLPKIDQTLAFAQKDIVPATKSNAVLTYDLHISPELNATDERIANYVRVSQGHFITNKYGERMAQFGDQARDIVASGLEKGWGSADIADKLYGELSGQTARGIGYWNTIAMVYANRARTMGQLAAYHEAGIEAYVWESVLDEATSLQCRFLHGRRFPVAHAMRRFQEVEDADSPEAIKSIQPFVSLGRDGNRDALVFGRGEDRQVVAHVGEDARGKLDEVGSFENGMDDKALLAAGITAPPIHGNCRSTIIPEFGGGGGGGRGRGGGPVPPPPPPPQPDKLTSGARKARALEDLHVLPTATNGDADISSLFGFQSDPPFLEHPMFAGDDAALAAQWDVNAVTKRPKLGELTTTEATVDRGVVEKLIRKPKALDDAPPPKVVQYEGKLYVIDGHEQLAAQKLLGQKTANCQFVNLDKRLKDPPLVHPIEPKPDPHPPTVVKPIVHPLPPPPKKAEFEPAPPPPRYMPKRVLPCPDLEGRRERATKLGKDDAARFVGKTQEDLDRMEIAARQTLKKPKGARKTSDDVASPMPAGDMPHGLYASELLARLGLSGNLREVLANVPRERVLVEDFVPIEKRLHRPAVERQIADLVKNKGAFSPRDQDVGHDGPPLLIRVGEKLYPVRGIGGVEMGAAKALGLKTVEAQVIDASPALAKMAESDNVVIFEKMKDRDAAYAKELDRVRRDVEARMASEHHGPDNVVAVRERHQPAQYAAKRREQYQEAAASVGWGEAMLERGLDFPIDHVERVARRFDVEGHPLREVAGIARASARRTGTLREQIAAGRINYDARKLEALAAIVGHADAIEPTDINLGSHDSKICPRSKMKSQLDWLATLVDRSVSLPNVETKLETVGRANCKMWDVTAWRSRTVTLSLKGAQSDAVVFHEMGHAIEASDRARGLRASAFLDGRTAGDAATKLSALTGDSAYTEDEVGRPDKFANPYVGKFYGRESQLKDGQADAYFGDKAMQKGDEDTKRAHRATEVTSMAIQSLGEKPNSRQGWMEAYMRDRDHFLFGLGQIGGY
jgi:hypothetical protein